MGLFDRWFGRKKKTKSDDDDLWEGVAPTKPPAVKGPPELRRAVELQQAYWTYREDERARLEAVSTGQLDWAQRMRLHHLLCMQRIHERAGDGPESAPSRAAFRALHGDGSPYQPRRALVWQLQADGTESPEDPHLQGVLQNPSLTHIGCLEVVRLDATRQPVEVVFVGFHDIQSIHFSLPYLMRGAQILYANGRQELALTPLLYGLSWTYGSEFDHDGSMTRFVGHLDVQGATEMPHGLGLGQQDLLIQQKAGSGNLFGIGSVQEIIFPLDMSDPEFASKARKRGMDPQDIRRKMDADGA